MTQQLFNSYLFYGVEVATATESDFDWIEWFHTRTAKAHAKDMHVMSMSGSEDGSTKFYLIKKSSSSQINETTLKHICTLSLDQHFKDCKYDPVTWAEEITKYAGDEGFTMKSDPGWTIGCVSYVSG